MIELEKGRTYFLDPAVVRPNWFEIYDWCRENNYRMMLTRGQLGIAIVPTYILEPLTSEDEDGNIDNGGTNGNDIQQD